MNTNHNIPKLPHAFFKWYCQEERYEELHGDLEEFYYERIKELGPGKARLHYCWDVIRCFQPYAWKKVNSRSGSSIAMFGNYSKTSLRNLRKNPRSSFINIVGLSIAIGICILVYAFSDWVDRVDQFHEHKNEVYLATVFVDIDGQLQQNGQTPSALAKVLEQDFPQVKEACRIEDSNAIIKQGDNVFHEQVRYADASFLELFTFPMKWGKGEALSDLNSIVLSGAMSIKYFGQENPVGKELQLFFDEEKHKSFKVVGVANAFPEAHAIDFDFLINFENISFAQPDYDYHDWGSFLRATVIKVDNPSDLNEIASGMTRYQKLQNEAEPDWAISSFTFEPLATLYQRSPNIKNSLSTPYYDPNHKSRIILGLLALFMLTLACLNYINIAIVSAAKRLKEIGLRKVIGANRRMVIAQFLAENMFITFFALILGLILGTTVIIPWFEHINDFRMNFHLLDSNLLVFLIVVLMVTGFLSGIYPAFYISKFQVVSIFKGSVKFGKKNLLTEIFLGFQIVLSCIIIVCAVMFTQNNDYMANRSWGYQPEETLYVGVHNYRAFEQMKALASQDPDVLSIAGSRNHLGKDHVSTVVSLPEEKFEVDQLSVDANYLDVMKVQLSEGRFFQKHSSADQQRVVVNELFVQNLNINDPLNSRIEIEGEKVEIIGVVKDFHPYSFENALNPTVFTLADKEQYQYLSVRVNPGAEESAYSNLKAQWASLYPAIPFQGGRQRLVWGNYFQEINTHGKFWRATAIIAILLAALGLFGMVALNVAGRVKEFSIRKVLGARLKNIAIDILKQYLLLFLAALLVGAPVSYFLVKFFFDAVYEYHVPITSLGVIVSVFILMGVMFAVIFSQLGQITKSNPIDGINMD